MACSVVLWIILLIVNHKDTTQLVSKDEGAEKVVTLNNEISSIAMYDTKYFYSESDDTITTFYVYDFETQTTDEVFHMPKFMIRGRYYTFIDDILYFYMGIDTGEDVKNVLYAMDFSEQKMYAVNENVYAKKFIPLANFKNQLFALQSDKDESGQVKSWIEKINENGTVEKVNMSQDVTAILDSEDKIMSHGIANIDADEQYLFALEVVTKEAGNEYYFVRYDTDLNLVDATHITDALKNTEVGEGINTFYAYGNYFCITNFSCRSVLCEVKDQEVNTLLYGNELEYVRNSLHDNLYEYFWVRGTNDIYRLNTQGGELDLLNFDLNNDVLVINYIAGSGNKLAVMKKPKEYGVYDRTIYFLDVN